jgi:hypothetical protein
MVLGSAVAQAGTERALEDERVRIENALPPRLFGILDKDDALEPAVARTALLPAFRTRRWQIIVVDIDADVC